jgi:steroid delta-isomerase-like uncharacterized protein
MKRIVAAAFFILFFSVSGYSQTTTETDFRQAVETVYGYFNSGELSKLSDIIAENFTEHSPMPGQKQGLAGLIEMMQGMKTAYPDMKFTVQDVVFSGDKAAVLFRFTGTNTGSWFGMPATNKAVDFMGLEMLKFNSEGKATDHWGYIEESKMMMQLGIMPGN